jgi:hypothetical protein
MFCSSILGIISWRGIRASGVKAFQQVFDQEKLD